MDQQRLLTVAVEAAREAAAVHRARAGTITPEQGGEKGVADYVTDVDREAEAAIVERIAAAFPDHVILAEEGAAAASTDAEWLWIVDPLDGTTNYLHGFPAYAASVAVAYRGRLLAGAVVSGATQDAWWASDGGGAFHNGERIRVSKLVGLRHALIGTGFPFKHRDLIPEYLAQFEAVLRGTAGIRRAGSAALDLCFLASGRFDGFWELWLAAWDVAAGALIVREAGGLVTRMDGHADVIGSGSILAGNPHVHAALLQVLRTSSGTVRHLD